MRIGVDLGGTKIEVVALDEADREIVRRRIATPAGDYDRTIAAVAALVRASEHEAGRRASVGIGTPGAVSRRTGAMKNANSTVLNGRTLREDLERLLDRPIRIANDADCFALSEASDGAAAGADVVFGVILGTGVGGGLVVQGHLLTGPNAVAGEWGHNPLPIRDMAEFPGPACYCGRSGCVETWLSGPGLAADHQRRCGGRSLAARELARAAARGEAAARDSLAAYTDRLARSLAVVINIVDPDVIVLGGGLSRIESLYTDVPAVWGRYVFSDEVRTTLVPNRHGDSSGVRGAARLWPAETARPAAS